MTIEKMHSITKMLDFLGKTEHIFFMSKEEYEKEFDFLYQQYPKGDSVSYNLLIKEDVNKCLIGSLVIDGITFHILNTDKL